MKSKALPYIILTGQVFLTVAAVTLLNPGCNAKVHIILAGFSFYVAGLMTLNFHLNQMESVCFGNRFIKVIRLMRHEFHNHLQVLFSMIQLKKHQEALKYIEDAVKCDKTINHIYSNLNDPFLICSLLEIVYKFRQKDININVEVLDKNPRLPLFPDFTREMGKYIIKFDKISGNKDIKIILGKTKVEVISKALGKKTAYKIYPFIS